MPGVRQDLGAEDVGGSGTAVQGLRFLPDGLRQERPSRRRPPKARLRRRERFEGIPRKRRFLEKDRSKVGFDRRGARAGAESRGEAGEVRGAEAESRQVSDAPSKIRAELARVARVLGAGDDVDPVLERPRDPAFGDWATNVAMVLARPLKKKPRDVAEAILGAIDKKAAGISSAEIAGPGFINFRLDVTSVAEGLRPLIAAGEAYGRSNAGAGKPVNVEFVSANPTGPLHVGHGRQAALGDAIAALLEWTGWKVSREFYYNDAGAQIDNLAISVAARVRGAEIPEGGYHGEYIREIAERYVAENSNDRKA